MPYQATLSFLPSEGEKKVFEASNLKSLRKTLYPWNQELHEVETVLTRTGHELLVHPEQTQPWLSASLLTSQTTSGSLLQETTARSHTALCLQPWPELLGNTGPEKDAERHSLHSGHGVWARQPQKEALYLLSYASLVLSPWSDHCVATPSGSANRANCQHVTLHCSSCGNSES